jgi:hypothetical protein
LTFGPEHGGVIILDSDPRPGKDEAVKTVSLPNWRERITAQMAYLIQAKRDQHVGNSQEVKMKAQHVFAISQLIEAMVDVYKRAEKQGDLTQAATQEYYRKHVATVRQTFQVPALLPD